MTDGALERDALAKLLRNEDAAAWAALKDDGWLDLVPEEDGTWPMVTTAATVAGVVASAGRSLPVGAHLAAAATLARVGDQRGDAGSLGVVTDLWAGEEGRLEGRCWSSAAPDHVLLALPDGTLGIVPGASCALAADPMPTFDQVDVRRISMARDDVDQIGDLQAVGVHESAVAFFLAAEALGAVQDAAERALAYLNDRHAFGQPLGSFQALQHRAVDVYTVGRMATSLLDLAASGWVEADLGSTASWQAKVFAGSRGVWAAEQAIQLHGGIGFTWELGLHHALRRAQRARLLLGGPSRAAAEVVARTDVGPRPGLTDWTLRPIPLEPLTP